MPWQKGQSGNPNGRKVGLGNQTTRAIRERIESEADPIGFLAAVMNGEPIKNRQPGSGGDAEEVDLYPSLSDRLRAAQILTGKIVPDAKDRAITFKVGTINGAADALAAMGEITKAMGDGELTPSEAETVMNVVGLYLKAYEVNDLEQRLALLETAKETGS